PSAKNSANERHSTPRHSRPRLPHPQTLSQERGGCIRRDGSHRPGVGIQAEMNVVSAYRSQGGELVWLWPGCWPICSQGIERGNRGSERLESAAPPGTRRNGWKPHDGQAEALLDPFGARGFWPRL